MVEKGTGEPRQARESSKDGSGIQVFLGGHLR